MKPLRLLGEAAAELEAIVAYLKEADPASAVAFLRDYEKKLTQIARFRPPRYWLSRLNADKV